VAALDGLCSPLSLGAGPSSAVGTGATGLPGTAGTTADAVATAQTTTSTTYTDLGTVGPAVTVNVPASGKVLVSVTAGMFDSNNSALNFMSFAISGATTQAAADTRGLSLLGNTAQQASASFVVTGLNAGSTTFTAKYRTSAGTATFQNRSIWVIPLP
jgi:hypothetical protein